MASEILLICAIDQTRALAELAQATAARAGSSSRVLRKGRFEVANMSVVPDPELNSREGFAEPREGGTVYCLVVEFS